MQQGNVSWACGLDSDRATSKRVKETFHAKATLIVGEHVERTPEGDISWTSELDSYSATSERVKGM